MFIDIRDLQAKRCLKLAQKKRPSAVCIILRAGAQWGQFIIQQHFFFDLNLSTRILGILQRISCCLAARRIIVKMWFRRCV